MSVELTSTIDSYTVSTEGTGASVQTDPASNIDFESAQLNGEVTDLGGETEVEAYFEYRETGATEWIETGKQTISSLTTYNWTVLGLNDDTEYEFRAVIDDTGGTRLDEGGALTYTTDVKQTGSVTTDSASNIGDTEAQLNGTLDSLGDFDSSDVFFRYRETGATTWTETTAQTLSATGSFNETITGLNANTEYEFKAVASFDGEEELGTVNTFTTLEESPAAEIVNITSPLENSEYESDIIRHVFDIEINEDDDYTVTIFVDSVEKFTDNINGALSGETYSYDENIDTAEFGDKTTSIEVKKQSDGS